MIRPVYLTALRGGIALAAVALLMPIPLARAEAVAEEAALRQLNRAYVTAFLTSDGEFFRSLLTEDFTAILADGRLIDRAEFLREAMARPQVKGFEVHDVSVRLYADAAVVSAWVSYSKLDGSPVRTRYFDLYVRRLGQWRLASVQWTRIAAASP